MNKYEIITITVCRISLFGIVIKKGTKYYNIKNNHSGKKTIYSDYAALTKKPVEDRCNYLNKYHTAEKYIIVKDANELYWIFNKTKDENFGVEDDCGVWYIKLNKDKFSSIDNLKTGCKTIEDAEKTLKEVYTNYEKDKNSKLYKIVSEQ